MKPIETALLSYGMSGRVFHAPVIQLHPGFNLVGSWERSKKNIENAYPGVQSYDSMEAVLADPSIELVIVNTPIYTHFEYAQKAMEAGKHIVVAAHGNSIRALIKYLDNVSDADIVNLNIPNGIPLVYELDANLKPIKHYYLGNAEAAAKAAAAVASQGKA